MEELELEGIIVDAGYLNLDNRSVIRLTLKRGDETYALFDFSFFPYFYVVPSNANTNEKALESIKILDNNEEISVKAATKIETMLKGEKRSAYKVEVTNTRHVPKLSDYLREFGEVYEYDIVFWKRYLIDKDISPMSGVKIKAHREKELFAIDSISKADVKGEVLNYICFDIETYNPRVVPKAEIDPSIMISYTNGKESKVLTTKKIDRPFVQSFPTEKAMIDAFSDVVKRTKTDVIAGYNSSNFDLPYLLKRAEKTGTKFDITRYGEEVKPEHHGLLEAVKISGRTNMDVYNVTKFVSIVGASEKLLRINRFTLGEVYRSIVGDTKITVEKKNIWQLWDGTKEDLENLADYSLSDSLALEKLYEFFLPLEVEVAKVAGTTLGEASISTTGQLVEHLLMRYAKNNNELIPNKPSESEITNRIANPFEGAYVKTPDAGIYDNIAVFDFRGLYPSIIIAHNIDPSTIAKGTGDFYESPDGTKFRKDIYGIVPKALKMLVAERTAVKKAYKKDPDSKELAARSQALKILANSFYGYLGYARSRWYDRAAASSVTAFGRFYINKAMEDAEKMGFKVLYGDSVSKDSLIRVSSDKSNISIIDQKIEEAFRKVDKKDASGKEYYFPKELYVETLDTNGRTILARVNYVMRHRTNKKVYRVWLTNSWYIDVTEDHSLIGLKTRYYSKKSVMERLAEVKPTDIGKDISSLVVKKKSVRGNVSTRSYEKELYELMGFFVGDGSFERNKYGKSYYLYLSCGNEREEFINKVLIPLKGKGIIKNIIRKGTKGDVEVNGLETVRLFDLEMHEGPKKIVPQFMFNEKEENIYAFLRGLFSSDGTVTMRSGKPMINYCTIDYELARKIGKLLWEVGISNSIFKENTENSYKGKKSGTYSYHVYIKSKDIFIKKVGFLIDAKNSRILNYKETGAQKKYIRPKEFDISATVRVEEISYNDYVYDLEVEGTHRFFANGILVHNTDSLFILLGNKTKDDAQTFLKTVNKSLPESMELELEDFYVRGVFVGKKGGAEGGKGAKKKYALLSESGRIKIKGFELVRRDWSFISREAQRKVLEAVLHEGSKEKAVSVVKEVIAKLRSGQVELKDLVIYTQLRKGIDNYDSKSPELAAAQKAVKEGLKTKDQVEGTTIGYIITKKGSSISEKAVLEDFAKDYDADYYIKHQVLPATLKILKELGFSEEELAEGGSQKRL